MANKKTQKEIEKREKEFYRIVKVINKHTLKFLKKDGVKND